MNLTLIFRRLAITLALAIVLVCVVAFLSQDAAAVLFLPSWGALFFAWPYLSQKLNFSFPNPKTRRGIPWLSFSRFVITGLLAIILSVIFAILLNSVRPGIWIIPVWIALYCGWTYLDRPTRFLSPEKAPASPAPRSPWRRAVRGIVVAYLCLGAILVFGQITLCFYRARTAHDSIHIGMTVPEMLNLVKGCDIFSASSDFPYDANSDADKIPAMSFGRTEDGTYRMYDLPTHPPLQLSAPEVIERLHAKLHDGYRWEFRYTYTNMTPQHISFSVVFGPDGRVEEVKPIYGWD